MENARISDVRFSECPIPAQQIIALRAKYPKAEIYYEVQLEITDLWQGLHACAKIFADSGLQCISMRYADGGTVFFRLKDIGRGALKLLEANLHQHRDATIQSWATVMCAVSPKAAAGLVELDIGENA